MSRSPAPPGADGMERPLLPAGVDVEGANVAGRGRQAFRHDRTQDQQIAVEDTRGVDADAECARIAALETLTQVDASILAELRQWLAGLRIERIQPVARRRSRCAGPHPVPGT